MVPVIDTRTIVYMSKGTLKRLTRATRRSLPAWLPLLWELIRFSLVGLLNTAVDLLAFNILLWLFPTQNTFWLLLYNSLAYGLGALNSFIGNKYWTFRQRQRTTWPELLRFIGTVLLGIACNDGILWGTSVLFRSLLNNSLLWSNGCKILAIFGTMSISYLGMRLWVFVRPAKKAAVDNTNIQDAA